MRMRQSWGVPAESFAASPWQSQQPQSSLVWHCQHPNLPISTAEPAPFLLSFHGTGTEEAQPCPAPQDPSAHNQSCCHFSLQSSPASRPSWIIWHQRSSQNPLSSPLGEPGPAALRKSPGPKHWEPFRAALSISPCPFHHTAETFCSSSTFSTLTRQEFPVQSICAKGPRLKFRWRSLWSSLGTISGRSLASFQIKDHSIFCPK